MNEFTDLTAIKGIGEKTAGLFAKLHIEQVGQLLEYYPRDYEKMEAAVRINELVSGRIAAVKAAVIGTPAVRRIRAMTITTIQAGDATGLISISFFNMPYVRNVLKPGSIHIFRGLCQTHGAVMRLDQPKIYRPEEYEHLAGTLQPRYALTAGITHHTIGRAAAGALKEIELTEYMPQSLLHEFNLCGYMDAIRQIHFPENESQLAEARRRLAFDEFITFFIALRKLKEDTIHIQVEYPFVDTPDAMQLLTQLPYELTGAQKRVWDEIHHDLLKDQPMNRLIQGDVGSGKTILAFLALLMCASNGKQGCLMAPTEVLARQHFEALLQMSAVYGLCISPILLTGSMTAKEKREARAQIESGDVNVIIGTHALIQDKVNYKNLSLVVTDEQHRFGVRQRSVLAEKGKGTHVLVMSATPIPRTLAIVLYGDLHVSILDEMPAGRKAILNCVVNTGYRKTAYTFIHKEVNAGHQVYVICPMVEEGEMEGVENVEEYTQKLKAVFPDSIRIASLHGKMKPAEKNRLMDAFSSGEIHVLVSTTVIEVGINVPNATVMMVENAERFGLAQLHQLRGRVGRGDAQSYCIFISGNDNQQTMERLNILKGSNDGFHIANEDLKLRGPGDLFGVRQSGAMEFKVGDIYNDSDLLLKTSRLADRLYEAEAWKNEAFIPLFDRVYHKAGDQIDFATL